MRMLRLTLSLLLLLATSALLAQAPSQRELDSDITHELQADGLRYDGRQVTLWVARGSLDEAASHEFLVRLDVGVEAIRAYLGEQIDEPVKPTRLQVFLSPRVGISHVGGDAPTQVYLPSRHVRKGKAPYLHELVHALASWSWRHSEWLGEGLANHVSATVATRKVGYHFLPVLPNGLQDLPAYLRSDVGRKVLTLVGLQASRNEFTPAQRALWRRIREDRQNYAPPFYAQSWSFVDFLVTKRGIAGLRALTSTNTSELTALKRDWLASLAVATDDLSPRSER